METEHQIPIWFFIGAVLLVYGLLILGTGLYLFFYPPQLKVALAEYHADIWWGALMVVMGAGYCLKFHPFRDRE